MELLVEKKIRRSEEEKEEILMLNLSCQQLVRVSGLDRNQLESLLHLNLSNNSIRDIDPIKYVRNLEELDLSKNRITSLAGIGRLRNLRLLSARGNFIEHIPMQVELLSQLSWVDLSENKLSTISEVCNFRPCSKLFRISLRGNPICKIAHYRATILSSLDSILTLDSVEIDSKERKWAKSCKRKGCENPEDDEQNLIIQNKREIIEIEEREMEHKVTKLENGDLLAENQELRSELDATTQLLARKTSEWAVAEEHSSRLEEELAFYRIENPNFEKKNNIKDECKHMDGLGKEIEEVDSSIPQSSWQESLFCSGFVNMSNYGFERSKSLPTSNHIKVLDGLEKQIQKNEKKVTNKINDLRRELEKSQKELEEMDEVLKDARKKIALSKTEQGRLRSVLSDLDPNVFCETGTLKTGTDGAIERKQMSQMISDKELEVSNLKSVMEMLKQAKFALTEKIEASQDLLVLRTETLVGFDYKEGQDNDFEDRRYGLEAKLKKASIRAASIAVALDADEYEQDDRNGNLEFLKEETSISLQKFHELKNELKQYDPTTRNDLGNEINQVSSSNDDNDPSQNLVSVFDQGITALSEQVEKTQAHEEQVSACYNACSRRSKQIEADIFALKHSSSKSKFGDASSYVENANADEISILKYKLRSISSNLETESSAEKALSEERLILVKVIQEIKESILLAQSTSLEEETKLRASQALFLCRVLDKKDATIDSCNRTIFRLQEEGINNQNITKSETSKSVAPRRLHVEKNQQGNENLTISSNMSQRSREEAKACRKRVYEDILTSERKYVEELNELMEVFINPMRKRALLPPRELQLICSNLESIRVIHAELLTELEKEKDARIVLATFDAYVSEFNIYSKYIKGYPKAVAMIVRLSCEVKPFSLFLRSVHRSRNYHGKHTDEIETLLMKPVLRILQYKRYFDKLVSLCADTDTTTIFHGKLVGIKASIDHTLQNVETNLDKLKKYGKTMALYGRFNKSKTMTVEEINWLASAPPEKRSLLCRIDMVDVLLVIQTPELMETDHNLQLHLRRSSCFFFTDCVVFAKSPSNWTESFPGELPKMKVYGIIMGGNFSFEFTSSAHGSDFPSLAMKSTNPTQRMIEAICRFSSEDDYCDAKAYISKLENASGWFVPEGKQENGLQFQVPVSIQSMPANNGKHLQQISPKSFMSISSIGSTNSSLNEDLDGSERAKRAGPLTPATISSLTAVSRLPGTDMEERRKIAKGFKEKRGSWVPVEKEKPMAKLARERIRKRDGILDDVETSDHIENHPNSAKSDTFNRRRNTFLFSPPSHRRVPKTRSKSVGFGSSAKLDRCDNNLTPRAKNSSKSPISGNRSRSPSLVINNIEWDDEGERFDSSELSEKEKLKNVNLGIFKSSIRKGGIRHDIPNSFGKRFIGADKTLSEYIKERHRLEEKGI